MDDEEFFYFYQVFRGMPHIFKGLCRLYIKSEFFKYLLIVISFIPLYSINILCVIIILCLDVSYKNIKEISQLNPIYMFNEIKLIVEEELIFI